jgi:hypothetical protein
LGMDGPDGPDVPGAAKNGEAGVGNFLLVSHACANAHTLPGKIPQRSVGASRDRNKAEKSNRKRGLATQSIGSGRAGFQRI